LSVSTDSGGVGGNFLSFGDAPFNHLRFMQPFAEIRK
jgi:hypothetical protein